MREIRYPASEEDIRSLKVGDEVLISGVMTTARDAAHKFMVEHDPAETPVRDIIRDGFIYHCGPVVVKDERGAWKFVAAGPTTSIREEPYEASVIERFGVRGIIGKGGMGDKTLDACGRFGCAYFHAIGGLATSLAACVTRVRAVHMSEQFGSPEAFWVIDVEKFPVVVTMDAHGNSLHKKIHVESEKNLKELLAR
jgi:fumarate hydratase subunit beta